MVGQPSVAAASWPVCVLAVILVAGAACAPDPEQLRAQRTIDAEDYMETGRLVYDAGVLVAIESQPDATGGYLTRVDVAR